jgi:hypothetical protein
MDIFYLGFWLPPDLVQRYPALNGAGQLWEGRLLQNLSSEVDWRTTSILDRKIKLTDANRQDRRPLKLVPKLGKELQAITSYLELRKT